MKLLFLFFCILFFVFAVIPINSLSDEITVNGPLKHIAAFCLLAFIQEQAFPEGSRERHVALLLAFGLLIELAQFAVPYRTPSLFDIAMDSIGISAYYLGKRILAVVR